MEKILPNKIIEYWSGWEVEAAFMFQKFEVVGFYV
jgi:hypothetical protein